MGGDINVALQQGESSYFKLKYEGGRGKPNPPEQITYKERKELGYAYRSSWGTSGLNQETVTAMIGLPSLLLLYHLLQIFDLISFLDRCGLYAT